MSKFTVSTIRASNSCVSDSINDLRTHPQHICIGLLLRKMCVWIKSELTVSVYVLFAEIYLIYIIYIKPSQWYASDKKAKRIISDCRLSLMDSQFLCVFTQKSMCSARQHKEHVGQDWYTSAKVSAVLPSVLHGCTLHGQVAHLLSKSGQIFTFIIIELSWFTRLSIIFLMCTYFYMYLFSEMVGKCIICMCSL